MLANVTHHYPIGTLSNRVSVHDRIEKLVTSRGIFALKVFSRRDTHRAEQEAHLLAHLQKFPGIRTQSIVRTHHEALLLSDSEHTGLLTKWIDGSRRTFDQITRDEWYSLGETLARLHRALASLDPFRETETQKKLLHQRSIEHERITLSKHHQLARAHAPSLANEFDRYFDRRRKLLETHLRTAQESIPSEKEQWIHNDYNQHNYLFPKEGSPFILDWDRALFGFPTFDVVRCLNFLPLTAPQEASSFLRGYQSLQPLRKDRLRWSIHAALTEHACKHWPVEQALASPNKGWNAVLANLAMLDAFGDKTAQLYAFFDEHAEER